MLVAGFLGVLSGSLPAFAQEPGRQPFLVLGPDQGLASGAVTCLAQTADGFMWMGTESGLLRYEGDHSRHWGVAEGLPSAYVYAALPTAEGGLWVGTVRGLVRLQDGRIEAAAFDPGHPANSQSLIAMDGRGRLWTLSAGTVHVQEEGLRFQRHPLQPEPGFNFIGAGKASGTIYLRGPAGILAYLPDGSTRRWGVADGLPADGLTLLLEDGQGRLWAGSGGTLVMKEPGAGAFVDRSRLLPNALSPNSLPLVDRDGSIWLPTRNGALHIQGDRSEVLDAEAGLPFRWVRSLFRDREGTLWVLGPALARQQGGGRVWNYTLGRDATGEVVWNLNRDREGRLLVATDDGAARLGPKGLARIPGSEGRRIKCLALDRAGTLWMVSTVGPALWLRAGAARAEKAPLGPLGSDLNTVFMDSRGELWFGHTRKGLLRWDPASASLVEEVGPAFTGTATLAGNLVREDRLGRLWAGCSAGLLVRGLDRKWRLFTGKDGLQPFNVQGMAFLPDGSAWINYLEPAPMTRVRLEQGRLEVLEQRALQGPRPKMVYAVQVDRHGRAWATTDQGLNRLDPPLNVGLHDGMVSDDCSVTALLAEDDTIWVGTASGLVRFDSSGLESPPAPPRARILGLTTGARGLQAPFAALEPIPSREGTLGFRVAVPSYLDNRNLRFQVRLLGLENGWHDTEARTVRYPALAGGRYRFEVRAAQGEGGFGPAEGIAFSVRPPWWRTWWALTLAGFGAAGAVLAIVRLRVASLARSKAELEALVAQRTRELSLRNGELSEALGNVKQLSGLLPICANCKKIRDDGGYWNQLEHYITEHSAVDFSHGICPECVELIYPEFSPKAVAARKAARLLPE
jgi:ligand-binding sensor domain-containing protein